jgi:hypothetical protein
MASYQSPEEYVASKYSSDSSIDPWAEWQNVYNMGYDPGADPYYNQPPPASTAGAGHEWQWDPNAERGIQGAPPGAWVQVKVDPTAPDLPAYGEPGSEGFGPPMNPQVTNVPQGQQAGPLVPYSPGEMGEFGEFSMDTYPQDPLNYKKSHIPVVMYHPSGSGEVVGWKWELNPTKYAQVMEQAGVDPNTGQSTGGGGGADWQSDYYDKMAEIEENRYLLEKQIAEWEQEHFGEITEYQQKQIDLAYEQLEKEAALAQQKFQLDQAEFDFGVEEAARQFGLTLQQFELQKQQLANSLEQQLWERDIVQQELALAQKQHEWEKEQHGTLSAWQQEQIQAESDRLTWEREQYNTVSATQQAQFDLQREQAQAERDWEREQWAGQMELQGRGYDIQEQIAASQEAQWQAQIAQQEKAYAASLAAQPHAFLEYAAYTGQQPAVQPWMQPLMSGEYSGLQAGEQIPGWSGTDMTGMPELTNPSRQYQARMGPTGYQQYLGYQQAQTGAPMEETDWRLWAQAAPGGRQTQMYRQR